MTRRTERTRTLEQVRAFLGGSEPVDFDLDDRDSAYVFLRRSLERLRYHHLGKPDKGLVKAYLAKVTGLSRAQLTRLIAQHRRTGDIRDRRKKPPATAERDADVNDFLRNGVTFEQLDKIAPSPGGLGCRLRLPAQVSASVRRPYRSARAAIPFR